MSRVLLALLCAVCVTVAVAEVIDLEGTVKAVDVTARTITIQRKTAKGTKTLELEVTKKGGDLSSVKAGDTISFSYDPELEVVTKLAKTAGNAGERVKPKKPLAAKGLSVPDPKDPSWMLVIKDVDSYREHWKEFSGGSYFYDPKTNVISAEKICEVADLAVDEPWEEIYFDMAVEKLTGEFRIIVNGKPFDIRPALNNARNGVPIRVVYFADEQSAKVFVGNAVAAETNIFDQGWNKSLRCEWRGQTGYPTKIKLRNFYIRKPAE